MAMEVDLRLQLVPQLVVGGPFHVTTEELNLLHSGIKKNKKNFDLFLVFSLL